MNLKLRLNIVTTSLLLLLMLAGIILSFHNARMNALAEVASAEKSTLYLIDNVIGTAPSNATMLDLSTFKLQQLSHMRHLKIELVDSKNQLIDSNQAATNEKFNNEAPAWFEKILDKTMPAWQPKVRNLSVNNQLVAKLIMTPDPSFE